MTQQVWQRLGRVFEPQGQRDWLISHASNPLPFSLANGLVRVFFNFRDANSRSGIAWLDWQPPASGSDGVGEVVAIAEQPVFLPGEAGLYDDSGASVGCIVPVDDALWLYYLGWNLGVTVPWRNSIGFAQGKLGEPFQRTQAVPLLDRHAVDPYSLSYPWVLREADQQWHMWYGSNLSWGKDMASMQHVIKYAHSADGKNWQRDGRICIDLLPGETGVARPCVHRDGALWRMWYGIRYQHYRIGYAESRDGLHWERRDNWLSWNRAPADWESDEQAYPCVFRHGADWLMLYDGNRYGATGFGVARLAKEGE